MGILDNKRRGISYHHA